MARVFVDTLTIEEDAKVQWHDNLALRAEFREFPCYLAFLKAQARGLVGINGTNRVRGGSAQRPIHREDRQELKKWVEQTVRQIRAEQGAPLTDVKPHKVQTLDGPRRLGDGDLLRIISSEREAEEVWHVTKSLSDEFPTPASLWHFVKAKRGGRITTLR